MGCIPKEIQYISLTFYTTFQIVNELAPYKRSVGTSILIARPKSRGFSKHNTHSIFSIKWLI